MNGFKLAFNPNLSYLPSWVLPKKHSNPYQDPVPGCLPLGEADNQRMPTGQSRHPGFWWLLPSLALKTAWFSPPELAQAKKQHGFIPNMQRGLLSLQQLLRTLQSAVRQKKITYLSNPVHSFLAVFYYTKYKN